MFCYVQCKFMILYRCLKNRAFIEAMQNSKEKIIEQPLANLFLAD